MQVLCSYKLILAHRVIDIPLFIDKYITGHIDIYTEQLCKYKSNIYWADF